MADARFLDLHGEVDKLYQAPLADFTAARNALVTRIKAAHGADAAAHVKALAKPSIAAWTLFGPLLAKNFKLHPYAAGTWGPAAADRLARADDSH